MTFFLIKLTKFEMKKVVIELKYTAIGKKKKTFETLISKAFSLINYLTSVKVVNVILAPFKRCHINVSRLSYRKCSQKCSHFAMLSILQFL